MADEDDDLSDLLGAEPAPKPQSPSSGAAAEILTGEALQDFLGPPPSRAVQAEARKQLLGPARVNGFLPGPGRIPGGKLTQERMRGILAFLITMPVVSKACRFSNIHRATLQLWITKSQRGQPGDVFDVVVNPDDPPEEHVTSRFHELYDLAMKDGIDEVEAVAIERAKGYEEALHYQGHIQYRLDPVLVDLGYTGSEAWAKDPNGRPIPETIRKQDTDTLLAVLKARHPAYSPKAIDMNLKVGGVLVVAAKALTGNDLVDESKKYLEEPIDVEFEEIDE